MGPFLFRVYSLGIVPRGHIWGYYPPIMENQMGGKIEHEIETGTI